MVIGEKHDGKRWVCVIECDRKVSLLCRHTWTRQRCKLVQNQVHICKACHNKLIAVNGRKAGLIGGKRAVETGQIKQFTAAGIAASQASPKFHAALKQNGKRNGRLATENGQLALARTKAHTPEAQAKRWETRKKNGTLKSSAPEQAFVSRLNEWFGNVQTHCFIDGFWIDVYVPSIDTYVQFDGEYYHGLDRPYDQLNKSQREKFDRDRRADQHFQQVGRKLLRVTDREFRELSSEDLRAKFQC